MAKYSENAQKSAEYLRLALPLMSKQAAGLHPVSYAVWYEYVTGVNLPLKAEIDKRTSNGGQLDEAATQELYRKYIAELDEESARRISQGFERILSNVTASTTQAGDEASRFSEAIARWAGDLDGEPSGGGMERVLQGVLRDTGSMQHAMGSLKASLDDSRREAAQLKQEVDRAREEALSDGLTGLVNRKGFDKALSDCLAASIAEGDEACLLLLDIDHFKRVNDTYGHLVGDKVIRGIAHVLMAMIKGQDTAARYGGEEFAVLLPGTPLRGAEALAEKLRAAVAQGRVRRLGTEENIGNITISIGVAAHRAGESANSLIARADKALYASKNGGRNRVTVADATGPA